MKKELTNSEFYNVLYIVMFWLVILMLAGAAQHEAYHKAQIDLQFVENEKLEARVAKLEANPLGNKEK